MGIEGEGKGWGGPAKELSPLLKRKGGPTHCLSGSQSTMCSAPITPHIQGRPRACMGPVTGVEQIVKSVDEPYKQYVESSFFFGSDDQFRSKYPPVLSSLCLEKCLPSSHQYKIDNMCIC